MIKGLEETLKLTNAQMEQFLTAETADAEYKRVMGYELKIITVLLKLEASTKNTAQGTQEGGHCLRMQAPAEIALREVNELVKLPKLKLVKFDGNKLMWQRLASIRDVSSFETWCCLAQMYTQNIDAHK